MNICGKCKHYQDLGYTVRCARTGRSVGYLWQMDCFPTGDGEPEKPPERRKGRPKRPQGDIGLGKPRKSQKAAGPLKHCPRCGRDLPLSKYQLNKSRKDGLQTYCRDCRNAISAAYYQKKREAAKRETVVREGLKKASDKEVTNECRDRGYKVSKEQAE